MDQDAEQEAEHVGGEDAPGGAIARMGEDGGEDQAIEDAVHPAIPDTIDVGAYDSDLLPAAVLEASPRAQAVVFLRSVGWSLGQVADVLGVTPQAVSQYLRRRGLQSLRVPVMAIRAAQTQRLVGLADYLLSSIKPAEIAASGVRERAYAAKVAIECAVNLNRLATSDKEGSVTGGVARSILGRARDAIAELSQRGDVAAQPIIDAVTGDDAGG